MSNWCVIRLELGRTPQFPNGSPSRTYLLRIPLGPDGTIDAQAQAADPRGATVRRYWPQQPDRSGYLVPQGDGWAFSASPGGKGECQIRLPNQRFGFDEEVSMIDPDGDSLPFRVAYLECDVPFLSRRA